MTDLSELQLLMERTYGERDRVRGITATVAWLAEEMGEVAKAVRKGSREEQIHEFGDTLASMANSLDSPSPLPRMVSAPRRRYIPVRRMTGHSHPRRCEERQVTPP